MSKPHTISKQAHGKPSAEVISSLLLAAALVLAPIIGGGFGELGSGPLEVLVFAAIAVRVLATRQPGREWARAPGFLAIAALAVITCVSTLCTESIYASLRQILMVSACIGGYLLAADLCRDRRIAAGFVWAISLSALGICLKGVRDYALDSGGGARFWKTLLGTGDHWRLFGTFINPGYFAGFLVISIPVALGIYLVARRSSFAWLAGLAVVIESLAMMLTGTKFAIVAAAGGIVVAFVLALVTRSLDRARVRRLVIMAIVLVPLLALFSGPLRQRVGESESGGTQAHSTTFRVYTWKATLEMIRHNPWIGVGPGVFETAYPRYTIAGPTKNAHQGFLQVAAEGGVGSLLALVAALAAAGWWSLRNTLKWPRESEDRAAEGSVWRELLPEGGRRLVCCALCGGLAGSVMRNLVDSDWYVIGIALPFGILAGGLVGHWTAAGRSLAIGRWTRAGVVAAFVALSCLSVSFGLGDYLEPDQSDSKLSIGEFVQRYELASRVSPLNPRYYREMAKFLVVSGDTQAAAGRLYVAVKLAPMDAGGYHVRGMVALAAGDPGSAAAFFNMALKHNPKSTQTLRQLSIAYQALGDTRGLESTYRRLLKVERSPYERIKGVPEMVDTSFVYAHVYFGEQYMARKQYPKAAGEFAAAVERLENWRRNKQILKVMRATGQLSFEEERSLLALLRQSRQRMYDAYDKAEM